MTMAQLLLPEGISVACLDFSGSGKSQGEYVNFGWTEKDDVKELVRVLREERNVGGIVLWGESMGAVAAILCAETEDNISCMVLDSPFSNLRDLFSDLMFCSPWGIGLLVVPILNLIYGGLGLMALEYVRYEIKRRCSYDINDVNPEKALTRIATDIPVVFLGTPQDSMVRWSRQRRMHSSYKGTTTKILVFDGSHEQQRPPWALSSAVEFVKNFIDL
eukprot:GHVU01180166.1.p1 GENE.GHVU01180166.1~~GHVU01180166.1.p1  ORF type:complete len:237 (+),score=14.23 GHVU01180166.1:59-712(+)